jgi:hypothetical protein
MTASSLGYKAPRKDFTSPPLYGSFKRFHSGFQAVSLMKSVTADFLVRILPKSDRQIMTFKRKKMVILASYLRGETYGLLGPQVAATIIQEHSPYACIVVAVAREDDKSLLKEFLADFFGSARPLVAFSYLSGREDLFSFARELRIDGALTILAGPQADVDYLGETGWREHAHRFRGLSEHFSFAFHGPAEQVLPFLVNLQAKKPGLFPGLLWEGEGGSLIQNPRSGWDSAYLKSVSWNNLYHLGEGTLSPLKIKNGQVLWQIGCPHAARTVEAEVDYPSFLGVKEKRKAKVLLKGCSFCDVAVDKGFYGSLDMETVLSQIQGLPETTEGRKIAFELVHENALPGLPRLLHAVRGRGIRLSQMNLTLRADWFAQGEAHLREALKLAKDMGIRIFLGSIGFESFDDTILANLHKGLDVSTNLRAIRLMRQIKNEFPDHWGYSREEGAVHGFIHPTPWDTKETEANNQKVINLYGLPLDILPERSIPLIIHHASALGDWIREVETKERIQFKREGTIIGWWQVGDQFVL